MRKIVDRLVVATGFLLIGCWLALVPTERTALDDFTILFCGVVGGGVAISVLPLLWEWLKVERRRIRG
jgi:hypothetical protein